MDALTKDLQELYPILREIVLFPSDSRYREQALPPFLGLLLSSLDALEKGAVCLVLPSRDRLGFTTAVLTALTLLERESGETGQQLVEREFKKGQLVQLAPDGYVFEFDGHFPYEDGKFFRLKVPGTKTVYSLEVQKAFRLSITDKLGRRPPKKWKRDTEPSAAIDELIGIQTGGNTAILPNRLLLLSSRSRTRRLSETTQVGAGTKRLSAERFPVQVAKVLTWGRITEDGDILSEDRRDAGHPPVLATTHMIEHLAAVCRAGTDNAKRVIIDGAGRTKNLQALDEVRSRYRTLILADYTELDQVRALKERGVFVWAPEPSILRDLSPGSHSLLNRSFRTIRNADELDLESVSVESGQLGELARRLNKLDGDLWEAWADERAKGLVGRYYSLLVRAAEWSLEPSERIRESYRARIKEIRDDLDRLSVWMPGELFEEMSECLNGFANIGETRNPGRHKTRALLAALEEPGGDQTKVTKQVVLVRTPDYARVLAASLLERGFQVPVFPLALPEGRDFDRVVASTWLSRNRMEKLIGQFMAPIFRLLAYDFEEQWYKGFLDARDTRVADFKPDVDRLTEEMGLEFPNTMRDRLARTILERSVPLDPVSRIETEQSRRRKGNPSSITSAEEAREARYVDFHGPYYAYLTESHSVPVVTDLVLGSETDKVPLRRIQDINEGDYLLFRDQGDHDIVSLIARQQMGAEKYEALLSTAHLWRSALRSIGSHPDKVYQVLTLYGLCRTAATVRGWLYDDSRIGPESEEDLEIIARASGDTAFQAMVPEIYSAIRSIRGKHIRAGFTLSQLLLNELPDVIDSVVQEGSQVDLTFGEGWVVCVRSTGEEVEERSYWEVNHLHSDDIL